MEIHCYIYHHNQLSRIFINQILHLDLLNFEKILLLNKIEQILLHKLIIKCINLIYNCVLKIDS